MVKDIRLYLDEARSLGLPTEMAGAVAQMWESTLIAEGPESDFTSIVKPIEAAAGVVIAARAP
jgi:3-hydroxyisobutyrate dehydrogenase